MATHDVIVKLWGGRMKGVVDSCCLFVGGATSSSLSSPEHRSASNTGLITKTCLRWLNIKQIYPGSFAVIHAGRFTLAPRPRPLPRPLLPVDTPTTGCGDSPGTCP